MLQPLLASVVLAIWAGQAMLMPSLGRQVKQKAAETARHNSIISETVRELVSGAAFIKSSGQDAKALSNIKECLHREWEHTRRGLLADHRARLIHAASNAGSLVLMYTAGGWFVLNGSMGVGSLVAFVAVYNWLRPFGISMIDMAITAVKIGPAIDRIADIAFPAAQPHKGIVPDGTLALEAKGITFRHESRTILNDIRFRIPPALLCPSSDIGGAGKSTLDDVLLGLQEPAAGGIWLNDIPLAAVDSDWLRQSVLCELRAGTYQELWKEQTERCL